MLYTWHSLVHLLPSTSPHQTGTLSQPWPRPDLASSWTLPFLPLHHIHHESLSAFLQNMFRILPLPTVLTTTFWSTHIITSGSKWVSCFCLPLGAPARMMLLKCKVSQVLSAQPPPRASCHPQGNTTHFWSGDSTISPFFLDSVWHISSPSDLSLKESLPYSTRSAHCISPCFAFISLNTHHLPHFLYNLSSTLERKLLEGSDVCLFCHCCLPSTEH